MTASHPKRSGSPQPAHTARGLPASQQAQAGFAPLDADRPRRAGNICLIRNLSPPALAPSTPCSRYSLCLRGTFTGGQRPIPGPLRRPRTPTVSNRTNSNIYDAILCLPVLPVSWVLRRRGVQGGVFVRRCTHRKHRKNGGYATNVPTACPAGSCPPHFSKSFAAETLTKQIRSFFSIAFRATASLRAHKRSFFSTEVL